MDDPKIDGGKAAAEDEAPAETSPEEEPFAIEEPAEPGDPDGQPV